MALEALGNVINQAGRDYYNARREEDARARALEDEARRRQQSLNDEARRRQQELDDKAADRAYAEEQKRQAWELEKKRLLELPEVQLRATAKLYGVANAETIPIAELRALVNQITADEADMLARIAREAELSRNSDFFAREQALKDRADEPSKKFAGDQAAYLNEEYMKAQNALAEIDAGAAQQMNALVQQVFASSKYASMSGPELAAEVKLLGLPDGATPDMIIAADPMLMERIDSGQKQIASGLSAKSRAAVANLNRTSMLLGDAVRNASRYNAEWWKTSARAPVETETDPDPDMDAPLDLSGIRSAMPATAPMPAATTAPASAPMPEAATYWAPAAPSAPAPVANWNPSFFGRDRDPELNQRRVIQLVKDVARTPAEMVAQTGRVLTPSNWKYDGSTRGGALWYDPQAR